MKLGFSLCNNQGISDVQALVALGVRAEALGFDSVWVHDHVFNVGHVRERIGDGPYYEPLALLSYVAARTSRVKLGTSVLVLPYHNPIRLAKTAATLDVLSGGRLILGVGVGAIEGEMEAMGTPFKQRGAFTDEAIAVMRELWTSETPRFDGRFSHFAGMPFSPKPVQRPIPITIGGASPAAIRRAARSGDGWQPLGLSPDALATAMGTLREEARACGRDAGAIPVAIAMTLGAGARGRHALGSKPAEVLDSARAFARVGAESLLVSIVTRDPREAQAALEMVGREVLPKVA
ncbi:MAG TPA: LLM class F420-dependent oxidoreductase [Methylomirabilota bacterium]|nr:LLM class F420-dependent oxidoreductase [Methylomirabilota bacterium]